MNKPAPGARMPGAMREELAMRTMMWAAALAFLAPAAAFGQSSEELAKGATKTDGVINYGMGYNLQRYSPLDQINRTTVKRLVPVWNYSLDDNRSEESQPIVYNGVIYITTHAAT